MGQYLPKPKTEKNTQQDKNSIFEYAVSSMQGWRVSMEDTHICTMNLQKDVHLFVVFDGHGGNEISEFCKEHFSNMLQKNKNFQEKKYTQALIETFYGMDDLMQKDDRKELGKMFEEPQMINAGCTAVALLITPEKYYVASAGDSRCIMFNKKGKVVKLTIDHKPENEKELKRIEKAGGFVNGGRVNGNLNLSRALGDLEFKQAKELGKHEQMIIPEPDVQEGNIDDQIDFFVLGCDGIWELKNEEEICEIIKKSKTDLGQTVENVLDSVLAKDTQEGLGCDNLSCIIVKMNKQIQLQRLIFSNDFFIFSFFSYIQYSLKNAQK